MKGAEPRVTSQMAALLRARRQLSDGQRRESPGGWWTKRALLAAGALWVLLGSFGTAIAIAGSAEIEPERAAVLFLVGPIGVASILMLLRVRGESGGHPLGEPRWLLPLSRWRSAWLAIAEDVFSPESLFIVGLGLAPWLGMLVAGAGWLNGWGWLAAFVAPLVAVGLRVLLASFLAWSAAAEGAGAAVRRIGAVGLMLGVPFALNVGAGPFGVSGEGVFGLPLLELVREPLAGPALAGATVALLLAGATIRSRPPLRWPRKLSARLAAPRLRAPSVGFGDAKPLAAMVRMMALTASRQWPFRLAVLLALFFGVQAAFFGAGASLGLVGFGTFYPAMAGLYNLYGYDARHYGVWLACGRRLDEWTRARQLFFTLYFTLLVGFGLGVVLATGAASATAAGVMALAAAFALEIALVVGPVLSREVPSAVASEVGRRAAVSATGSSWLQVVAISGTAGLSAACAAPYLLTGAWWTAVVGPAVLLPVAIARLTQRDAWSGEIRERFAGVFRTVPV